MTQALSCPECGKAAAGNFCQHCGAGLGGRFCNQCGESVSTGSKFCNQCGTRVLGGASAARAPSQRREAAAAVIGGQNLPWWIAGAAMFVLIVVVGVNMVRPGPGPAPSSGTPTAATTVAPATGGSMPDLSAMTPLEAADRLFDRVMRSFSSGDTAGAQAFMPMALAAYDRARPLNLDGLFHLSMLNRSAGNAEAALADAVDILDQDATHLLGLSAAAEASWDLGELDAAERYYRTLLEAYDRELSRGLPEYEAHGSIVAELRGDAEAFLAER